jgi:hypothetical protein
VIGSRILADFGAFAGAGIGQRRRHHGV